MKVIGTTKDGYILEATTQEIARLVGYYGTIKANQEGAMPSLGSEIQVNAMYEQLYKLAEFPNTLKTISGVLEGALNLIKGTPALPLKETKE